MTLLVLVAMAVALAAAGVGIIGLVRSERRRLARLEDDRTANWREFGERHGLRYRRRASVSTLEGTVHGVDIGLETARVDPNRPSQLGGRGWADGREFPPNLRIRRASPQSARKGEWVGDPAFDGAARLEGDAADLAAILDEETRDIALSWLEVNALDVEDEWLTVSVDDANDVDALDRLLNALVHCTHAFALRPDDRARRLAHNATIDPVDGVRLNCLQLLAERHHEAPETLAALEAGLVDPSPEVRLFAAERLGDPSVGEHARAVAALLADGEDDEGRAAAIRQLATSGQPDDVAWLRPLTKGLFRSAALKTAAQEAIDGILVRHGVAAGALAVVAEGATREAQGRLSATPDLDGALSDAEDPRRQGVLAAGAPPGDRRRS